MQYFKHLSSMRNDPKIKRVIAKYGLEGYGLYNLMLESIAGSVETNNPMPFLEETCEDIAMFYNGNSAKIEEMVRFMISQGLFSVETVEKRIACFKIYKYFEQSQTRSEKIRELISEYHKQVDLPQMSQTNLIEENRIEEIRLDKKKEEKQPVCVAEQESPKSSGVKRIEAARSAWNDRAPSIGPTCRLMAITFKPEDTTDCLRIMNAYSDAEIIEAMDNYCKIRESQDHEVKAPYQSFVGFIRGGVEKFISESDPWSAYKRRMSFDEMQEAENRRNMIAAGLIPEEG